MSYCTPKPVPNKFVVECAKRACAANPSNHPGLIELDPVSMPEPQWLAVSTGRYWGPRPRVRTVGFMESISVSLRNRILKVANGWKCGVTYVYTGNVRDANVRVTRNGRGLWSYVGTDTDSIPRNRPTMSLGGYNDRTPDSELVRGAGHEFGHDQGYEHEHLRKELVDKLDPDKVIAIMRREQGWSAATTRHNMLTPLEDRSIMATPIDVHSLMCYQISGRMTYSGNPIPGGATWTESDLAWALKMYPLEAEPEEPEPDRPEPLPDDEEWDSPDWGSIEIQDGIWAN